MRQGLIILACLMAFNPGWIFNNSNELTLFPSGGKEDFSPFRLSVGPQGEIFVLDRVNARLHRFSPRDGREMWRTDGSESGEAFIDPAFLSRPDGFFIYLTDRGSRKVWRIDYRGEIRGSLDLPFAADPVFFELASGHRFVLYDRAGGLVHLLDDSGRSLFSFPPDSPGNAAEPVDMALDGEGKEVFFLWPGNGGISTNSLSGQKGFGLEFTGEHAEPEQLVLLDVFPMILARDGRRYLAGSNYGNWINSNDNTDTSLRDICYVPGLTVYSLKDNPPRLVISVKERPD
jgi:hypothetical protein